MKDKDKPVCAYLKKGLCTHPREGGKRKECAAAKEDK